MDFESLRDELVRRNQKPAGDEPDEIEDTDDLVRHIRIQAERVTGRLTEATDTGERNRLKDRQDLMNRWLAELRQTRLLPADARNARRQELRSAVLEEFSRWKLGGEERRAREAQIELGHKHLKEMAKPGALTHAHKRLKDELDYLLKNYTPTNDNKIEALIDKWRRSGDPAYDPSVKIRLRNARRKKGNSDYAL